MQPQHPIPGNPSPRLARRFAASLLAAATVACSSGGAVPTPVAEVAPVEPPARFAWTPSTTSYEMASHRTVSRQVQGQEQQDAFLTRYRLTSTVEELNGTLQAVFTVDTVLEATARDVTAAARAAVVGRTFRGEWTDGRPGFTLAADTSVTEGLLAQIQSDLQDFYPPLPAEGLEPGTAWTDSSVTPVIQPDSRLIVRSSTSYQASEWRDDPNGRRLPVAWTTRYTVEGEGEQLGQVFTIAGTGRASGDLWLAADGRYLGSTRDDRLTGEIVVEAFGIAIPIVQTRNDTLRVR